jgi:hypothetical protein
LGRIRTATAREAITVSVTQYYDRLSDEALKQYRANPDTFRLENYLDSEAFASYAQECLLAADLAAQATTGSSEKKLVFEVVSGVAGTPLFGNDDYPFLIDRETVALASRLLVELHPEDLRRACDLGRLKARYWEVEEWLWESWGPNVFDKLLLPTFEKIRGLYHRAAERKQQVIVGWF